MSANGRGSIGSVARFLGQEHCTHVVLHAVIDHLVLPALSSIGENILHDASDIDQLRCMVVGGERHVVTKLFDRSMYQTEWARASRHADGSSFEIRRQMMPLEGS
jgi:hypothetical protein